MNKFRIKKVFFLISLIFSANLYAEEIIEEAKSDNNIKINKTSIEMELKDSMVSSSKEVSKEVDGPIIKEENIFVIEDDSESPPVPVKKPPSQNYFFKMAIQQNDLEGVKHYIDNGGDIKKSIIYDGNDILHISAMKDQRQMFEYALSKGMSLFKLNNSGNSPLHIAAYLHNLELIKLIFNKSDKKTIGKLIKLVDSQGKTLLHNALLPNNLYQINEDLVKYLIGVGFDINLQDKLGQTPLHYATLYRSLSLFKYMVSIGGNIFIENNFSDTPIKLGLENMNFFEGDQAFYSKINKSQVDKYILEIKKTSY